MSKRRLQNRGARYLFHLFWMLWCLPYTLHFYSDSSTSLNLFFVLNFPLSFLTLILFDFFMEFCSTEIFSLLIIIKNSTMNCSWLSIRIKYIYDKLWRYFAFRSEFLEDLSVLIGLFVSLSLIVTCQLGSKFFIEPFKPFISFDFRFEWSWYLSLSISTSLFIIFSRSSPLNQGWLKIYSKSPWDPNLSFGFFFKILIRKSWASRVNLTFSLNLISPSLINLNINDWDLL